MCWNISAFQDVLAPVLQKIKQYLTRKGKLTSMALYFRWRNQGWRRCVTCPRRPSQPGTGTQVPLYQCPGFPHKPACPWVWSTGSECGFLHSSSFSHLSILNCTCKAPSPTYSLSRDEDLDVFGSQYSAATLPFCTMTAMWDAARISS